MRTLLNEKEAEIWSQQNLDEWSINRLRYALTRYEGGKWRKHGPNNGAATFQGAPQDPERSVADAIAKADEETTRFLMECPK